MGIEDAGLVQWAAGVADAALRIRFDVVGIKKGMKTVVLRLTLNTKDKRVMNAWCKIMDIESKVCKNGQIFIPARQQERILGVLVKSCLRDDLQAALGFRRMRGSKYKQIAGEIAGEIKNA